MEQFVQNGVLVSSKVDGLANLISPSLLSPPLGNNEEHQPATPPQLSIADTLTEIRALALELRDKRASDFDPTVIQARLESVLAVMDSDRQRFYQQNSGEPLPLSMVPVLICALLAQQLTQSWLLSRGAGRRIKLCCPRSSHP